MHAACLVLLRVSRRTATGRGDIDHLDDRAGGRRGALVAVLMLEMRVVLIVVELCIVLRIVSGIEGGMATWLDPGVLETPSTLIGVH